MINGATEIIGGIPAGTIDPLLLPGCHGPHVSGYIVISHPDSPEVFDILFLKGKQIVQCASVNGDLHLPSSPEAVRGRIHGGDMVHLFHAPREMVGLFARTFHLHPRIKVKINELTQRQVGELLKSTACARGILEIGSFTRPLPAIVFNEFTSSEELLALGTGFRKGVMMLYDTGMDPGTWRKGSVQPEKLKEVREQVEAVSTQALKNPPEVTPSQPNHRPQSEPKVEENSPSPELVRLLERILRSFRLQAFEILGRKMERMVKRAEKEMRLLTPEFDTCDLQPSTALVVLDLISSIIRQAPMLKRARLKSIALVLIGDLYDKNLELLEQNSAVAQVEQCYYRLKG
jgi:hypothetical protein